MFNLGCPTATDITSIAKMLIEEMKRSDVRFKYTGGDRGWPGDVPQVRFNTSKMEKLGWKPKVTFYELVKVMVDSDMEMLGLKPVGEGKTILKEKFSGWHQWQANVAAVNERSGQGTA